MGTEHDAWSRAGASAARRGVRRRIAARGRNCRPHFELARKRGECGSAFVCYSTTPLPLLPRPGSRPPTLDSRLSTGSTGCPNQCAKHKRHRTRHCPTKSPITCRGENLYSPSPLHSCPNHLLRSKKSIQRRSTRGIVLGSPHIQARHFTRPERQPASPKFLVAPTALCGAKRTYNVEAQEALITVLPRPATQDIFGPEPSTRPPRSPVAPTSVQSTRGIESGSNE